MPETIFSPCRRYRYTLWREWSAPTPQLFPGGESLVAEWSDSYLQVIGLNPSTADETKDDPTIRRCITFAKAWGFSALCMTNLFAYRATNPARMKDVRFPVGPDNNEHLFRIAKDAGLILAAWGTHGAHRERDREVCADFLWRTPGRRLLCLGTNGDGSPKHPLYIPASTQPEPFRYAESEVVT